MQRTRIGFPVQFHDRAQCLGADVIRLHSQGAIQHGFFLSITGEITVTQGKLLKHEQVARVEINRALETMYALFPAPLMVA